MEIRDHFNFLSNSSESVWKGVLFVSLTWTRISGDASLVSQMVKNHLPRQETQVRSLGGEDTSEEEMAIHFSTLAWKTPWTEEPGRLYSSPGRKESDTTEWVTHSPKLYDCWIQKIKAQGTHLNLSIRSEKNHFFQCKYVLHTAWDLQWKVICCWPQLPI